MAFETINTGVSYFKLSDCKEGQVLIENGVFKSSKAGQYGNTWMIEESDGTVKGLNETGQLKYMKESGNVKVGDVLRVVYNGKKDLKGGKTAHDFTVQIDMDARQVEPTAQAPAQEVDEGDELQF